MGDGVLLTIPEIKLFKRLIKHICCFSRYKSFNGSSLKLYKALRTFPELNFLLYSLHEKSISVTSHNASEVWQSHDFMIGKTFNTLTFPPVRPSRVTAHTSMYFTLMGSLVLLDIWTFFPLDHWLIGSRSQTKWLQNQRAWWTESPLRQIDCWSLLQITQVFYNKTPQLKTLRRSFSMSTFLVSCW